MSIRQKRGHGLCLASGVGHGKVWEPLGQVNTSRGSINLNGILVIYTNLHFKIDLIFTLYLRHNHVLNYSTYILHIFTYREYFAVISVLSF